MKTLQIVLIVIVFCLWESLAFGGNALEQPSCSSETVQVKFHRICPSGPWKSDHLRLETASHPLLTVEAKIAEESLAYPMYFQNKAPTLLLNSFEMPAEIIADKESEVDFILHYAKSDFSKLPSDSAPGWAKIQITLYLCDDANHDGKCSDEERSNQLVVHIPTYEACHLPTSIPLDVYSCDTEAKAEPE